MAKVVECPCGYGRGVPPFSCLRCRVVVTVGTEDQGTWAHIYGNRGAVERTNRRLVGEYLTDRYKGWDER